MTGFKHLIYHLFRLILAGVFIYASIDKILHPDTFAQAVTFHQILPVYLVNPTAIVLPWLELFLGLCLLFHIWMTGAAMGTALLMTVFTGIILFNLYRGLDVSCGCFSTAAQDPMDWVTLVRDIGILCVSWCYALLVFLRFEHRMTPPGPMTADEPIM